MNTLIRCTGPTGVDHLLDLLDSRYGMSLCGNQTADVLLPATDGHRICKSCAYCALVHAERQRRLEHEVDR